MALRSGDRLAVNGPVALVWEDGSRLDLAAGAQVRVVRPGTGPGLLLERGTLTAEIARQRPGLPFAIATAEARIEVLGTHFTVSAQAQRTQVDLFTGVVRMLRVADGSKVVLRGMETATIAADVEFAAHPFSEPVPAAGAPAPAPAAAPTGAEPVWIPLFATDGLGEWSPQHGTWTEHDGVVRGVAGAQDAARLLGRRDYQDVELTCRLRVSDALVAELQVGDYNWFAEIPAHDGAWVAVALTQHGNDLRVTVDGLAVPLLPGAGLPPRAGPLAFYVRPGGALEIDSARVRVPTQTPR
ncbi:MAG: FecR domain-containing protein [Planctomycetes bacterium]|nr:FecR domain-containing protein [Planctomycetota bacterium]